MSKRQKVRLLDRQAYDAIVRRDNEFAVRRRLISFLEFVPDANLILDNLPRTQLKNNKKLETCLNDSTVDGLLSLILKLLDLLDFMPVQGTPEKPYVTKIGETVIARPANNLDFERNRRLHNFVALLADYYQTDFNLILGIELANEFKKNHELKNELGDPRKIKALKEAGISPEQYIKLRLSERSAP